MTQSAFQMLLTLKGELEDRLQASEDYRALKALEAAIANLNGTIAASNSSAEPVIRQRSRPERNTDNKGPSQADAAETVLDELAMPVTTADLLEMVREKGAKVGGNDPLTNLSSSLSRDPRFVPIRVDGKSMWWLAGRPYAVSNAFQLTPTEGGFGS